MNRTIMIMAGGTGGHVMPALAVADYLRNEGWKIVWLGTRNGMEATLVPQHGYEMAWINFSGLRGKGLLRTAILPVQLLAAFFQSFRAIMTHRPHVVLGMGGYPAFPGGMMAALLARPLVVHEQNSIAGLTNRVLACLADKVLVAFPDAFKGKKDKPLPCGKADTEWCGNPVRAGIAAIAEPEVRLAGREGLLRLLVVGGSLGAAALNERVPQAVAMIPAEQRPNIVHQSGTRNIEALRANYQAAGVAAECKAFIDNMAEQYAWADIVICRSGALTVAEVAAAGVASVLVPYPHAVDDHQTTNARFLSESGAAILIQQSELNAERLALLLQELTRDRLLAMAQKARALAKPDAARQVAEICRELAQ
ncbi:MAG: undecaprenyldiphospho-muramoylpentapeptide beta-N-acetylglucosaminyltransferase [Sulfurimicrobium sp.]|nr:undecaprenyldiphospho-muramoylpentapeptide beta-N-acetylglucosaminyltransferase [Sulfurimicrobium sp.]MDO9190847.1 undecaprenyldiphospho-muramoylpentapeptide beta-N-acetylglucosaminyltransferase [Sulfurimicrobium sp.]MDP1703923.1 undecaprenyldiphospho-muramoylpentapeptide beta-N-acetylglucosaminyltransferase [Sulfurimicrobium sp.]MDP1898142.1 undecaprenyldiphospho-muramoylpentapeptide beta-N-acetylglucosaminyltransferase [Sulfurimicrobium sp.]MDP2197963.1 undecaprenyldiphospho-muramoylpentap